MYKRQVVDPEILIVDEILSVGDMAFQAKSEAKMRSMIGGGTTVLFVSHSLAQIENLCDRAIWLEHGQVVKTGPAKDVYKRQGESYEGQVAVGAVILNRVKHPSFPNTIAGVIYEPGAFTAVSDGQINHPIDENSTVYKAARDAMNGWDPTNGCIYYFNPNTATNKWIWSKPIIKTIGKHNFCTE